MQRGELKNPCGIYVGGVQDCEDKIEICEVALRDLEVRVIEITADMTGGGRKPSFGHAEVSTLGFLRLRWRQVSTWEEACPVLQQESVIL